MARAGGLGLTAQPVMDRTVLQAIFDAVDIHREGRVSRHRLIQALSEDATLHRLLGIAEDQVRAQVRRDFLAAFGFDGGEDAVVSFEQFASLKVIDDQTRRIARQHTQDQQARHRHLRGRVRDAAHGHGGAP